MKNVLRGVFRLCGISILLGAGYVGNRKAFESDSERSEIICPKSVLMPLSTIIASESRVDLYQERAVGMYERVLVLYDLSESESYLLEEMEQAISDAERTNNDERKEAYYWDAINAGWEYAENSRAFGAFATGFTGGDADMTDLIDAAQATKEIDVVLTDIWEARDRNTANAQRDLDEAIAAFTSEDYAKSLEATRSASSAIDDLTKSGMESSISNLTDVVAQLAQNADANSEVYQLEKEAELTMETKRQELLKQVAELQKILTLLLQLQVLQSN